MRLAQARSDEECGDQKVQTDVVIAPDRTKCDEAAVGRLIGRSNAVLQNVFCGELE